MNDRQWSSEELTEEEARLRHQDCEMIEVFSIVDRTGERRPAIFVFRTEEFTEEDDDGRSRRRSDWLKPTW